MALHGPKMRVCHESKCNQSRSLFLSCSAPSISSRPVAVRVILFKSMSDHVYLDKPSAPAPSQWHPIFMEYQSTLQWSVWPHIIWLFVTSLTSFTILPLDTFSPSLPSWLFLQHSDTLLLYSFCIFVSSAWIILWIGSSMTTLPLQATGGTFLPSFKIVSCPWALIWHSPSTFLALFFFIVHNSF